MYCLVRHSITQMITVGLMPLNAYDIFMWQGKSRLNQEKQRHKSWSIIDLDDLGWQFVIPFHHGMTSHKKLFWVNFITTEPCSPEAWNHGLGFGKSSPFMAARFRWRWNITSLYPDIYIFYTLQHNSVIYIHIIIYPLPRYHCVFRGAMDHWIFLVIHWGPGFPTTGFRPSSPLVNRHR